MERYTGIEPVSQPWEGRILPLNQYRGLLVRASGEILQKFNKSAINSGLAGIGTPAFFQAAQLAAVLAVARIELLHLGPEFGGMIHFEEVAVFVDDDVLLQMQRQFGQVDVEVEVVIGGSRAPARAHFLEADAFDGARRKAAQQQHGFLDDIGRGAAVKFFLELLQLFFLLAAAEIVAEGGLNVILMDLQP